MINLKFKARDQVIADYQRDHKLRDPSAATGPGTQPYLDAVMVADQIMPITAAATQMGRALQLDGKSLEELQELATKKGIDLSGAVGSTGYVTIRAASGGTTILSGDECKDEVTGLKFRCVATKLYAAGDDVPIAALSTGPATNLDAGTTLQWMSPRAGCSTTCVVAKQTDGSGLSGGADAEGREQIIAKIIDAETNPPAAGNNADYRAKIRKTPGVQIEEAFIYPAVFGPGTLGWTFTVSPNRYGSRIPSAAQEALVRAFVYGAMPATDLQFYLACSNQDVDVAVKLSWADGAAQWANETPWPGYLESAPSTGSGAIRVGTVTSATAFQIVAENGDYTTCGDPTTGVVVAVWDKPNRTFRRKTILSVTGTGPWDVACDTSYDASDTTYAPVTGQRVMPWSDSLDLVVAPVVAHFEKCGPGEITHDPLDGRRGVRDPASPKSWPSRTTKALDIDVLAIAAVSSSDVVEGANVLATTHSSSPRLIGLDELSVFQE